MSRRTLVYLGLLSLQLSAGRAASLAVIDPALRQLAPGETTPVLVTLLEQADLSAASSLPTKQAKGRYVFSQLQATAQATQGPVLALLRDAGVEHRALYVTNGIWVRANAFVIEQLSRSPAVVRLMPSPQGAMVRPESVAPAEATAHKALPWGLRNIRAPEAWAEGARGAGVVLGSIDTGVHWLHPAIGRQYRGNAGGAIDHDYNWHDAVHGSAPGCNGDSLQPCDADGHGTHTVGTMLGDDGDAQQIGVAPDAQWIACRCWEPVARTDLVYVLECMQWMLAPTDLQGQNPDPDRAPHAINNSWICEPDEGCTDPNALLVAVQSLRAAGIVVVAGAGNSGPTAATISFPPAIYVESFTVGATSSTNAIASFSSRGPVTADGSGRIKPDFVAPGVGVTSAVPPNDYESWAGTSMAAPHVAGVLALMISAQPALAGHVDRLERILRETSTPLGSGVPNTTFGYGKVDALAAVLAARQALSLPDAEPDPEAPLVPGARLAQNQPNPFNPLTRIVFELSQASTIDLEIYDAQGRLVRQLAMGRKLEAGRHALNWDGRDGSGAAAASGIYFYRLRSGTFERTRRMALIR